MAVFEADSCCSRNRSCATSSQNPEPLLLAKNNLDSFSSSSLLMMMSVSSSWKKFRLGTAVSTNSVFAVEIIVALLVVVFMCFLAVVRRRKLPRKPTKACGDDKLMKNNHHSKRILQRKQDFLRRAGDNYGYAESRGGFIDDWRPRELPNLIHPVGSTTEESARPRSSSEHGEREVYLDYAGSALPTQSQLQQILELNTTTILANPHSTGPAASRTLKMMEEAKTKILNHFHAHPGRLAGLVADGNADAHPGYEIVFTSGATEAFRIVAERFPKSASSSSSSSSSCTTNKSLLVYPQNAHTSVVGMRAVIANDAYFVCKPMNELLDDINQCHERQESVGTLWRQSKALSLDSPGSCDCSVHNNLLVLPMECNFGGDRPDVQTAIQKLRASSSSSKDCWYTMLDVAKAASTGPVNLCELDPDFACVSFYKLFGVPTGLGCLFVKRTAIDTLMRTESNKEQYFGGGSVDAVLPVTDFAVRRSEPTPLASLHNGTIHFRGIVSLLSGFDELDRIGGMNAIKRHTTQLAGELVRRLRDLKHDSGRPAVVVYGAWNEVGSASSNNIPGPTVAFNILRKDGSFVGYNEVSKLASLDRPPIQMRTGCFCNPGACQLALKLTDNDVIHNYKVSGHVCGDHIDIIDGKPTGAIRASFGKDSVWEDLDALVTFIEKLFVGQTGGIPSATRWNNGPRQAIITELYLFPIKSCAAQRVKQWPLEASSGKLIFDREFALVDSLGTAMRLQAYPKMAFLRPTIDLSKKTMTVSAPDYPVLQISLGETSGNGYCSSIVKVCGNRCGGMLWGDVEASDWFSRFLGVQCWLARYSQQGYDLPSAARVPRLLPQRGAEIAFANEQPLLLVSEEAIDVLNDVLTSQNQKHVSSMHFRPNLVVRLVGQDVEKSKSHPNIEDGWKALQLLGKAAKFDVAGPCARCSMVDVDPSSGMKGKTLRALADYRRCNGQISFGIFLRGCGEKECDRNYVRDDTIIAEGDLLACT